MLNTRELMLAHDRKDAELWLEFLRTETTYALMDNISFSAALSLRGHILWVHKESDPMCFGAYY